MSQAAFIALIVANLIVAALVLLQDWGYYAVLIAYWWEAVIIGLFNLARVVLVFLAGDPFGPRVGFSGLGSRILSAALIAVFFAAKFGALALITGFWILATPAIIADENAQPDDTVLDALAQVAPGVAVTVAVLLVSHAISFLLNFIGHREYRQVGIMKLLFWPYARLGLTVVVVVLGLVSVYRFDQLAGSTVFALTIVACKLGGDLWTHRWEHSTAHRSQPAVPA